MTTDSVNHEIESPPQNGSTANSFGAPGSTSFLDIEDLATCLRVDVGFLRRLVAKRRIPFVKLGKFVRFDPAEIAAWIDGQRVPPVAAGSQRMDWRN
jgi:excisionase family DNA binding protein